MRTQRHITASLLLAVLVYGGFFAPLHHSINMALGGFYPMAEHHGEKESCHEMAMDLPSGERMAPHDEGHPECPFMELFTISLLSYSLDAASVSISTPNTTQKFGFPAFYWQDNTHQSYSTRAPPLG